jgi:hypothetical protein
MNYSREPLRTLGCTSSARLKRRGRGLLAKKPSPTVPNVSLDLGGHTLCSVDENQALTLKTPIPECVSPTPRWGMSRDLHFSFQAVAGTM